MTAQMFDYVNGSLLWSAVWGLAGYVVVRGGIEREKRKGRF